MQSWHRASRIPSLRNIAIISVVLLLLYYFRTWSVSYKASPAPVQSEEPPVTTPEPTGIPKKIWYKLRQKRLSGDARGWTNTCVSQNPEYHAGFFNDQFADAFVLERYKDRPEIVDTYIVLTVPILKVDLFRYLLLYSEGGVWFDLDATCEGIPIDKWVPDAVDPDSVVGWEYGGGYHFEFNTQFTTWTVPAKKGVRKLLTVAEDVVKGIAEPAAAENATISGLNKEMVGDVVGFTGPKRFAKSVMESIVDEESAEKGEWGGWEPYHEILGPKLAGDVLILPGYALAALYSSYEPEDQDRVGPSLVVHHYAGTWKNEHGGETPEGQEKSS